MPQPELLVHAATVVPDRDHRHLAFGANLRFNLAVRAGRLLSVLDQVFQDGDQPLLIDSHPRIVVWLQSQHRFWG